MTWDRATPNHGDHTMTEEQGMSSFYTLLDIPTSASVQQIRQAYRELSKLYHPDTTALPAAIATAKFQQLNEAYATLSSPEKRMAYDLKLGYSRLSVMQQPPGFNRPVSETRSYRSSAYLEPFDRPLSAGEMFALFILGLTFAACLVLVVAVGFTRGGDSLDLQSATVLPLTAPAPDSQSGPAPTPAADPVTTSKLPISPPEIAPEQRAQPISNEPDAPVLTAPALRESARQPLTAPPIAAETPAATDTTPAPSALSLPDQPQPPAPDGSSAAAPAAALTPPDS